MRPTKLTTKLVEAFRTVLADELAAIAFTEDELVWQANQYLPLNEQISYRTYQRYKADILSVEEGKENKKEEQANDTTEVMQEIDTENTELVRQMYITLKSALFKQKFALVKGLDAGLPNWRRYSWMLERKFPDFRLRLPAKPTGKGNEPIPSKPSLEARQTITDTPITDKPKTKPELTELERIESKWGDNSCYVSPWYQGPSFYTFHLTPEELRSREEEMADDEAKGYVNPYANLGYQPATCPEGVDYNDYENGWYTFYTMGKDTPRLPIRLWAPQQISARDTPTDDEKESIWAKQEWQRQHPDEQYLNEHGEPENIHVFTRKTAPEPWDKDDIWDGEPRPTANTDGPNYGSGRIYGSSAGYKPSRARFD